ncbi:helix-turn-helix transcriptional regulator [Methylobacterium sp. SyP6R]|uniref:helix-turn-helix transcriptional regulator n=1 Tax=Methylobacterium sp. SyP6R TaxID=2718876 RepID=UPI001F2FD08E|nr:LuxR family transcriptional regulator [Methylobacterium sp. SyP6R]MCF4126499.1 LuxR family transcriptional regulator [Methylobacterium sp. SyP6R]
MTRRTLDTTLAFLRALDRAASPQDVGTLLRQELSEYGVEHMLAGMIPSPGASAGRQYGHVLLDGMPPAWIKRYAAKGYIYRDATVRRLCFDQEPFTWSSAVERYADDPMAVRIMHEAADHGARAGLTIPLLTLDASLAACSVSGRHFDVPPDKVGTVQLIATYAAARLMLLRGSESVEVRLTDREREVLQWAADGKTAWETGEILAVSSKTVEHHLSTSRQKLRALNGVQAVANALRQGLIH